MALRPLAATYRLQLREGVDFDAAARIVPHLARLGISHLYLAPICTAASGSTHGYDVTDPAAVDPVLGGEAGLRRLAAAARAEGLSLVIDIVPNHTAFSLENPWLRDVLAHGEASAWAAHFDIAPGRRLRLPFLPRPFAALLAEGALRLGRDEAGAEVLRVDLGGGEIAVPLAPGSLPADPGRWAEAATIAAVHGAQGWELCLWEHERDGVTHRRFFNITALIGMRVEVPEVFDALHALPLRLLREGVIQGLRVDHVDGLADPGGYLQRLRAAAGPQTPIWVEKILTGDEDLRADWPVEGTTGYEAIRQIVRLLTPAAGIAALDAAWQGAAAADFGPEAAFAPLLRAAKDEIMTADLAAELHELIALARAALAEAGEEAAGPELLRGAVLGLLREVPRYRTYLGTGADSAADREILAQMIARARPRLGPAMVAEAVGAALLDPAGPAARRLLARFQQVTGALVAKALEDTVFYRYTRSLAACEVGSAPQHPVLSAQAFGAWMEGRQAHWPKALTCTSSHDTKRAEDARMRLVACAQLPQVFLDLHRAEAAQFGAIPAAEGWYLLQSAVAIWEEGRAGLGERLAAHMQKAMREAKLRTTWAYPDAAAEAPVLAAAAALAARWEASLPEAVRDLAARGAELSLVQLALKILMPGVPDIYQGTETGAFHLADPDNRMAVDFAAAAVATQAPGAPGLSGRKGALMAALLSLRARHAGFFLAAGVRLEEEGEDLTLLREIPGGAALALRLRRDGARPAQQGDAQERDTQGGLLPPGAWPLALEWRRAPADHSPSSTEVSPA